MLKSFSPFGSPRKQTQFVLCLIPLPPWLYLILANAFSPYILLPAFSSSQGSYSILHSVQFSCSVVSSSLRPHGLKHVRPPCPSPTPRVYSNPRPLSQWYHPTILSSVVPFSSRLNLSQNQGLFQWVSSSHQVAKVLEFQLQHQSFQWIFRTDFL